MDIKTCKGGQIWVCMGCISEVGRGVIEGWRNGAHRVTDGREQTRTVMYGRGNFPKICVWWGKTNRDTDGCVWCRMGLHGYSGVWGHGRGHKKAPEGSRMDEDGHVLGHGWQVKISIRTGRVVEGAEEYVWELVGLRGPRRGVWVCPRKTWEQFTK